VLTAVRGGDESAFATAIEPYRRQIHVHCYRMLGSYDEAEDLVQETLLRAWRSRAGFEGRSSLRTWLYRIATNACLDALDHSSRRWLFADVAAATDPPIEADLRPADLPSLQPYPDRLLDEVAPTESQPDAVAISRETIELAYMAAIQYLPPRQRAILILRDTLGWSAKQTAALLDTSVASVNSALQRAHATMRMRLPAQRLDWRSATGFSDEEHAVLRRYMDAHDRADVAGFTALLRKDARKTMPPFPIWFAGRGAIADVFAGTMDPGSPVHVGVLRVLPTAANRQPAAAFYLRRPGDIAYRPISIDVLRIEGGLVTEITAFASPLYFPRFGLPPLLT